MAQIVDGKKIADEILAELKGEIKTLKSKPKLAVFLAGDNPASISYVEAKQKKASELGIGVEVKKFEESVSQEELQEAIRDSANESNVCGILVQLPLPAQMNARVVLDTVPPELDVDALNTKSKTDLIERGEALFVPPAASAVLAILDYYKVGLRGKHIVIVGTGDLVGKPLSALLLRRKADFELANRYTENLDELLKKADVVVSAVGKAGLVSGNQIKQGAVVIDAGTTGSSEGAVVGDVDEESVKTKASLLSPVPGGVGPVTIAKLFENLVKSAAKKTSGANS